MRQGDEHFDYTSRIFLTFECSTWVGSSWQVINKHTDRSLCEYRPYKFSPFSHFFKKRVDCKHIRSRFLNLLEGINYVTYDVSPAQIRVKFEFNYWGRQGVDQLRMLMVTSDTKSFMDGMGSVFFGLHRSHLILQRRLDASKARYRNTKYQRWNWFDNLFMLALDDWNGTKLSRPLEQEDGIVLQNNPDIETAKTWMASNIEGPFFIKDAESQKALIRKSENDYNTRQAHRSKPLLGRPDYIYPEEVP